VCWQSQTADILMQDTTSTNKYFKFGIITKYVVKLQLNIIIAIDGPVSDFICTSDSLVLSVACIILKPGSSESKTAAKSRLS